MRMLWPATVALTGLILTVTVASSQPPPGRDGGRRPGEGRDGPPPGGPPRFQLGRVLPPPLVEELDLTPEQQAEIAKLEKEVKQRLSKILTVEQKKKVENFRPRGPGEPGRPPRGPDRPRPASDGETPPRPERPERDEANSAATGIQWYATWDGGQREAERSGRPILLVSAAPHCAGVSGTW